MFVEEYLIELRSRRYSARAILWYIRATAGRARENAYRNPHGVRSVITNAVGVFVFFLLIGLALAIWVDGPLARRFFVYQTLWLFAGTVWLLLHVGLLRSPGGTPLGRIGVANQLSFLRLALIPSIYLFIVEDHMILALVSYALAGLSDVLDGYFARKLGSESRFGLVLDPLVDVGYILGIFGALYRIGWVPSWVFAVVCVRYALLLFGALIIYLVRARVRIQPTAFGKVSGVVITGMNLLVLVLGSLGLLDRGGDVRSILMIGLGFLFAAACVQLVVIGVHNLRDGEKREAAMSKVVGNVGPTRHRS
jgi:cardiolipin synthase